MEQPGAPEAVPPGGARPTGRPPLTERRKAATRLEIAHAAVRLFDARGVAATSGAQIAREAGISLRTLWRYFPSKEECVRPLLSAGLEATAARLRRWPADRPLSEGLRQDPSALDRTEDAEALLALVRLLPDEPGLRAVWLSVHRDAEPVFTGIIAARTGDDPAALTPRVKAVMLNAALRVAAEEWARVAGAEGAQAGAEAFRHAVLLATGSLAL
ncbi:TetR/AcrR family transcriptional regulator [Streptomyces sp. RFCAC02]|uniref:TetR/AcrR family transcriptional regulator n=1 Tax=Streptomyces sp. RFCAC02 TaxID=2499143 RepID=UPI001F0EED27|nr:TetR/AcrR family transcriptional regulator [Streptomyces sp. RFCAC02]